jgi:hypothetical protein
MNSIDYNNIIYSWIHSCPKRNGAELLCYLNICPLCGQGKGFPSVNINSLELGILKVKKDR